MFFSTMKSLAQLSRYTPADTRGEERSCTREAMDSENSGEQNGEENGERRMEGVMQRGD
jgi:hypothetical protein